MISLWERPNEILTTALCVTIDDLLVAEPELAP